jgi:hypothetical protein
MPSEWLPGEPPQSGAGKYFRLKDLEEYPGQSADIRVLEPFIHGWEVWCKDGKPHRADVKEGLPAESEWRVEDGKRDEAKPFWAAPVWNPAKGVVQLFSFTQGTVYRQLKALAGNKKWGALDAYDLTIKRSGKGLQTKYDITPNPKEPLSAEGQAAWAELNETWSGPEALLANGDPFEIFGG